MADIQPPIPPVEVRNWMLSIGYISEHEVEEATGTTAKSRSRWKSPKGIMWGNFKWFPLDEIKRHLDSRAENLKNNPDEVAIL